MEKNWKICKKVPNITPPPTPLPSFHAFSPFFTLNNVINPTINPVIHYTLSDTCVMIVTSHVYYFSTPSPPRLYKMLCLVVNPNFNHHPNQNPPPFLLSNPPLSVSPPANLFVCTPCASPHKSIYIFVCCFHFHTANLFITILSFLLSMNAFKKYCLFIYCFFILCRSLLLMCVNISPPPLFLKQKKRKKHNKNTEKKK